MVDENWSTMNGEETNEDKIYNLKLRRLLNLNPLLGFWASQPQNKYLGFKLAQ